MTNSRLMDSCDWKRNSYPECNYSKPQKQQTTVDMAVEFGKVPLPFICLLIVSKKLELKSVSD